LFNAMTPTVSLELGILALEAVVMFAIAVIAFHRIRV